MLKLTISGGKFKNRCIECPKKNIRPVMARIRKSIFQIVENYCAAQFSTMQRKTLKFLDLFSGSGLMALEAVSREYGLASAVEKDDRKWGIIQRNFLLAPQKLRLVRSSSELFILRGREMYDLIYIDPPFAYKYKKDILQKLSKSSITGEKTLLILHIPTHEVNLITGQLLSHTLYTSKHFGGSTILFYVQRKGQAKDAGAINRY